VVQRRASDKTTLDYGFLINTKRHKIGTEEALRMAIIRDYWDQETVTQVVDLLKEYEYLFL
jgi:hypothetical protein